MFKKNLPVAVATALLVPSMAFAGPPSAGTGYVGSQFAFVKYDIDNAPGLDVTGLVFRGGYFFTDYFSVEGRLGFGVGDDTVNVLGTPVKVEIDRLLGVYGVAHLPLSHNASLYGVLGYTDGKAKYSVPGVALTDSDSGLSWGAGINFYATDNIGLSGEYMSYLNETGYEVSAFSLGLQYHF